MPRISAPTLAEHRDNRRAALLAAGRDLVAAGGHKAVTMAAVASRTGLSRPAVYEYFSSTDDLLAAVLLDEMRTWTGQIVDALATEATPEGKVHRYISISLTLIADGRHDVLETLVGADFPDTFQQEFGMLHATLAAPLSSALDALGVTDTHTGVRYLQGVVEAAARRIAPGDDIAPETERVHRFVMAGLSTLRAPD